ncbi:MAG: thermonuclease family protein [Thermodesulfobacteriota bacterium]
MRKGPGDQTNITSILVLIAVFIIGSALWTFSGGDPHGKRVLVTRVVDGDTIYVGRGWRRTKVRLIGVDTPETVHPEKPIEFYGPEASAFTRLRLKGKWVHLEFEPSEEYDRYGRMLAYVFSRDGALFNAELIQEGYARIYAASPFRYKREFRSYEREAKEKRLGIWSSLDETLPVPYEQVPDEVYGEIICNRRSKIYHLPDQVSYDLIKEENRIYFDTEEAAIAAGCRKAKR